jgi:hypothetical protein
MFRMVTEWNQSLFLGSLGNIISSRIEIPGTSKNESLIHFMT